MTAARMLAVLAGLTLLVAAPAGARPSPDALPLPTGFQPEGIDIRGQSFYVGSIPTGAVFRGDLRTGSGSVLVPA